MPKEFRFRVLIMGRANAGKTTILKKICDATESPVVRNQKGKVIKRSGPKPSDDRGVHDIDLEIVYPSRSGFVFHDSMGLECGSEGEMDKIFEFIKRRAGSTLDQKLHLVWYCINTADPRPLPPEERRFFEFNTNVVPVVVIFTKYDALETKSLNELRQTMALREAIALTPGHADDVFQRYYSGSITKVSHPPAAQLRLKDLHKDASCQDLIEITASVLSMTDGSRKQFILATKYNLESRIKHALESVPPDAFSTFALHSTRVLHSESRLSFDEEARPSFAERGGLLWPVHQILAVDTLSWFPHLWDQGHKSFWEKLISRLTEALHPADPRLEGLAMRRAARSKDDVDEDFEVNRAFGGFFCSAEHTMASLHLEYALRASGNLETGYVIAARARDFCAMYAWSTVSALAIISDFCAYAASQPPSDPVNLWHQQRLIYERRWRGFVARKVQKIVERNTTSPDPSKDASCPSPEVQADLVRLVCETCDAERQGVPPEVIAGMDEADLDNWRNFKSQG